MAYIDVDEFHRQLLGVKECLIQEIQIQHLHPAQGGPATSALVLLEKGQVEASKGATADDGGKGEREIATNSARADILREEEQSARNTEEGARRQAAEGLDQVPE